MLPLKVDYVNTVKDNMGDDSLIEAIDDEKILLSETRVSNVVRYILEHYNQKTDTPYQLTLMYQMKINLMRLIYYNYKTYIAY